MNIARFVTEKLDFVRIEHIFVSLPADFSLSLRSSSATFNKKEVINMERTKCEVFSRVVGYLRPVAQWHEGKQAEFKDRKTYKVK